MALMRLFFAVPIPPDNSAVLSALCSRLQTQRGWHWVDERNWHITLAFLGETDGNCVSALSELGEQVAANHPSSTLTLDSLQWWPTPSRPRLLAAVAENAGALPQLRKQLAAGLRDRGINFDGKPLRPHVTLMRLERGIDLFDLSLPPCSIRIDIETLALYRSERQHGETRYRPIWQRDLIPPTPVFFKK
jgi:RNA 2',3'-cyclic 3'-phosphodiesterase